MYEMIFYIREQRTQCLVSSLVTRDQVHAHISYSAPLLRLYIQYMMLARISKPGLHACKSAQLFTHAESNSIHYNVNILGGKEKGHGHKKGKKKKGGGLIGLVAPLTSIRSSTCDSISER